MLDIFHNDAFSIMSLTDAMMDVKYIPGRIGQLGLFQDTSITTTTAAIEKKGMQLVLIPPTPRGGPGTTLDKAKRSLRAVSVPHFEINDAVMAEEVQGVRAFGSETAVETVQGVVAGRFVEHQNSYSITEEYARIGAIKGIVIYADGSELDLFKEFDVARPGIVYFDLSAATPVGGIIRQRSAALVRQLGAILDGLPFSGILAECGDAFFDALIMHPEVRQTYLNTQAAGELRGAYVEPGNTLWGRFEFGGIVWENYRGSFNGAPAIPTNECQFIPMGVPGLFRRYISPADYIETVNTPGILRYAKQYDMPNGKGVHLDTQTNQLNICTRPGVLIRGSLLAHA